MLRIEDDFAKIANESIDVLAVKTEEHDEGKGAAETFSVFQRSVGAGIHHEQFGKFSLSQFLTLAGFEKALGHVVAEGTFAGVLYG